MNEAYKDLPLIDNAAEGRFEMIVDRHMAIIEYTQKGDVVFLTHTEVPAALEGKGAGAAIVEKALHFIEANNYKLVPYCPFVVSYLKRHPEWKRVLRDENSLDE